MKDRVIQAAMKNILEPVFEADFLPCSYGFRPGRGAHAALEELRKLLLPQHVKGENGTEVRFSYPERRIIPQELWDSVHERLASVGRGRMRREDRPRDQRIVSGKQNCYPLSGLLRCAVCNAPMTIHGGSNVGYYRCSDNKKRGTCANLLALREDVAREKILSNLYAMLKSPAAILRMRKRVVERLAEEARGMNTELEERRARLARTEEKIARLVEFISEGQQSDYVVKSLRDLEAQAATEKKEIARLKEETAKPVELPRPDFFIQRAHALENMLAKDPLRGREQLHRLFEGGQLKLYPQLTGSYVAEGQFYPLGILGLQLAPGTDGPQTTKAPPKRGPRANLDSWSSHCCAGARHPLLKLVEEPLSLVVPPGGRRQR